MLHPVLYASSTTNRTNSKKVLKIAHITDVHIRPEPDAPNRFRKCLNDIKKNKVDFFLNGGDTRWAGDEYLLFTSILVCQ